MSKSFVNNNGIYLHSDAIVVDDVGTTLSTELNNIKTTTIPISRGGTNATTVANARSNLGLGTLATESNLSNQLIMSYVESSNYLEITKGGTGTITITMTKSGYTFLGMVGCGTFNSTAGAGSTHGCFVGASVSSSQVSCVYRSSNQTDTIKFRVRIYGLYRKN